ncbi:hypothetical protein ACJIZ3_016778 [Penstemon smallii]|uniref:Uncharacterized protein n=1 Tax=Penstemon smallii TaxID=265156 RepID=A0ABD3STN1_9LAMI
MNLILGPSTSGVSSAGESEGELAGFLLLPLHRLTGGVCTLQAPGNAKARSRHLAVSKDTVAVTEQHSRAGNNTMWMESMSFLLCK